MNSAIAVYCHMLRLIVIWGVREKPGTPHTWLSVWVFQKMVGIFCLDSQKRDP